MLMGQAVTLVPWRLDGPSECHDGVREHKGVRCQKSPANALIASGFIGNTTG
jgi:hypothetical protein